MAYERIETNTFVAEFPGVVAISDPTPTDGYEWAKTTDYWHEITPFDLFEIRLTEMPIDPFIAVGPTEWTAIFGDAVVSPLRDLSAEVLDNRTQLQLGLATRTLVIRFDYEGPRRLFSKLVARPDGQVGHIAVAKAVVDCSADGEQAASRFLDSLRMKWAPSR